MRCINIIPANDAYGVCLDQENFSPKRGRGGGGIKQGTSSTGDQRTTALRFFFLFWSKQQHYVTFNLYQSLG